MAGKDNKAQEKTLDKGQNPKILLAIRLLMVGAGALLLCNMVFLLLTTNVHAGHVLLGVAIAALFFCGFFWGRFSRKTRMVICVLGAIPLVLMMILGVYGNCHNVNYDEDALIVLGAGIRGEEVSRMLSRRLDDAVKYYNLNPQVVIVVCGGQGFQEDIPEALAMERYLVARGVPPASIVQEDASTSTLENLTFAKALLRERFPQGFSGALITNDYHVFRAVRLAQSVEMPCRHIGSYTEWYGVPNNYLRELLAVGKMLLLGQRAI
ncbi:MAG: YdcF family protein [Peptococcaceae bacterium]|nr:YdcF family protein [Peptococcaceae bacterium]